MASNGMRTCGYSLLITAVLLALYGYGHTIKLPGIDYSVLAGITGYENTVGTVSIFILGIMPFVLGFIVVEILSMILPAGLRLRSSGSSGRARLNRASIFVCIGICLFQSIAVAIALERSSNNLLVPNPGWSFRLMTCVTLTTGSLVIFYIAMLISLKGIANGFCILIAYDILTPIFRHLGFGPDRFQDIGELFKTGSFICLVIVLLLIAFCQKTITANAETERVNVSIKFDLPIFPQGVLPLGVASWALNLPSALRMVSIIESNGQSPSLSFWLLATIALIVLFSIIGIWLFSSRKRIVHNLPVGIGIDHDLGRLLRNQAIKSTSVLVVGAAAILILGRQYETVLIPSFGSLIILVTVALDAVDQWRFSWKHGRNVELIELDNAHLASYLKGLLESNGFDSVVQTYRFRRLLYFLCPLTKMRILVAPEDQERARALIERESIQIV